MATNQHVLTVNIFWPDDKWENDAETQYAHGCLQMVLEHLERTPLQRRAGKLYLQNKYGRVFAEIEMCPVVEPVRLPEFAVDEYGTCTGRV